MFAIERVAYHIGRESLESASRARLSGSAILFKYPSDFYTELENENNSYVPTILVISHILNGFRLNNSKFSTYLSSTKIILKLVFL